MVSFRKKIRTHTDTGSKGNGNKAYTQTSSKAIKARGLPSQRRALARTSYHLCTLSMCVYGPIICVHSIKLNWHKRVQTSAAHYTALFSALFIFGECVCMCSYVFSRCCRCRLLFRIHSFSAGHLLVLLVANQLILFVNCLFR